MSSRCGLQPPKPAGAGEPRAAHSFARRLLDQSKLPRLPATARNNLACVVCDGKLDSQNEFQQSTKICGDCLGRFARVGAALDAHADQKAKAAKLARRQGGINY